MADFAIIADVSHYIRSVLVKKLCPQYISAEEGIMLISPNDKNVDYQVGIYLYDIEDNGEYVLPQRITVSERKKLYPPKVLKLKYMIYINSKGQIAGKEEDCQRILGMVIQTFYDLSEIDIEKIHSMATSRDDKSGISLLNLSLEEKIKIWTGLTLPYQAAVYVEVAPIVLDSKRFVETGRVVGMTFQIDERGESS